MMKGELELKSNPVLRRSRDSYLMPLYVLALAGVMPLLHKPVVNPRVKPMSQQTGMVL